MSHGRVFYRATTVNRSHFDAAALADDRVGAGDRHGRVQVRRLELIASITSADPQRTHPLRQRTLDIIVTGLSIGRAPLVGTAPDPKTSALTSSARNAQRPAGRPRRSTQQGMTVNGVTNSSSPNSGTC